VSGTVIARSRLKAYAWLAWGAAVLFISTAPAGWILGLAPHASWSLLSAFGHAFEFGLFVALLARWGPPWTGGRWGLVWAACVALAFGLAVELIQLPIPYRSFDLRDWAADAAGIAAALLLRLGARAAARLRPG
jgi:VanZ family protein